MNQPVIIISLVLIFFVSIACAMFRSMLKSTLCLATVSALLSIVLFMFGATWAGIFELSVCAGLVTVIFTSAISLTDTDRRSQKNVHEHKMRYAPLPFILIFCGVIMIAFIIFSGFSISATPTTSEQVFRELFWNTRQADILGQIIVILAGAFAVLILFKEGGKE